ITFHGSLTEPEVAKKLDEADLFVLPSIVEQNGDTEGIPVALMEAMAAGVPVVASRITGVPELVRDGSTGVLVEPGNAADLADKLPPALDPEGLMVPPDELRAQIEHLRDRNYRFVTSSEFAARLHAGASLNGICALTFDDGSVDNATVLPDILASLDVPATLFVCPGLLGKPHPWIEPEAGVRLMDRDKLYYTSQLDFIEIGAH